MKSVLRTFITLVPVATLLIVCAATLWYHHDESRYLAVYDLLSNLFGYSATWLPVYFYMAQAYHLCNYTMIALYGLAANSIVNIAHNVFVLFGLQYADQYMVSVELTLLCTSVLLVAGAMAQSQLARNGRNTS